MGWPGPLTHRQFAAWQSWNERQMDQPSRADWYAMALCATVRGLFAPASPEDFKLAFSKRKPISEKAAVQRSIDVWTGAGRG